MERNSAYSIREQLQYTGSLFRDIRKKFNGPNVVRGGHERTQMVSLYARAFKGALDDGINYSVEASYTEEQLKYVNDTLIELRGFISGRHGGYFLADRIVDHYLHSTTPYFTLAMIKASEVAVKDFVDAKPHHAIVLDAIFRVAGSEGFRDLIHIYGTRLLESVLKHTDAELPGIFTFIDIHETFRRDASGNMMEMKYEVWCPGHSLAKIYFDQCKIAARKLVEEHKVQFSPPHREEIQAFPFEISVYMREFLQRLIAPVLEKYQIGID